MTACEDRRLQLHALIDGELDAANSVAIEAHVATCAGCAEDFRRLTAIRDGVRAGGVRHTAPEALKRRIEAQLAAQTAPPVQALPPPRRRPGGWLAGGTGAVIAAGLTLMIAVPQLAATRVEDQLVASHVRSLLAGHLTDVATSDQHVVKPWFNGRVDFAPPVVELADQGFPLAGGRLDYIDGRVVSAIVYHRRLHTINLFVRPAGRFSSLTGVVAHRDGYSLVRWTQGGLEFWAVSDIGAEDLQLFHRTFAASVGGVQR